MNIIKGLKTEVSLTGLSDQIVKSEVLKKRAFWVPVLILIFAFYFLYNFPYIYGKKTDDSSFYIAARGISSGINIYDQKEFYRLGDEIFGKSVEFWPYLYSPVLAELLVPIASKSYETFTIIWFIFNILLSFSCVLLTFYTARGKKNINYLFMSILLVFCLMSTLFSHTLVLGQVSFLVYFMIILSMVFYKNNQSFLSSFFLAMAAFIKSFPLIYILYFLIIKDWRYIKNFILSNIAIILPSLFLFGPAIWIKYLHSTLNGFVSPAKTPFYLQYFGHQTNSSLRPFLVHLFESLNLPISRTNLIYLIITTLIIVIVLFALVKAKGNILYSFSVLSVTYLIISPICWRHNYVLMMLPLIYTISLKVKPRPLSSAITLLAALIIFYYPIWMGFPFNQFILLSVLAIYFLLLFIQDQNNNLIENKAKVREI